MNTALQELVMNNPRIRFHEVRSEGKLLVSLLAGLEAAGRDIGLRSASVKAGAAGGVDLAVFQSLLHELGKPFLTENTILKVLQLLILKCFATGCNLEQTFGQDVPSDLGGLKGRHSGATILKGHC